MESILDQSCNKSDVPHRKCQQPGSVYIQQEVEDDGEHFHQHMQSVWAITCLMMVEYTVLWIQGERLPHLHHNLLSMCHGLIYQTTRIIFRGFEFACYVWLWKNYAIFSLTSDTVFNVVTVALLTDFAYYWFHRAAHEIGIFWAIHQVHHSSDDITMSVGLRHSPIQRLFVWVFYLPLAFLGVPPAHMVIQENINKLYQCWIHTTVIDKLGPLEYIFNTPCHHRVHHGSNLDYLDTNYGGIFIIWDRMFGTFKSEEPNEKTVYNLLFVPQYLEPFYNQLFYLQHLKEKANGMDSWWHYICTFIKGPSWIPGSKWTGEREDEVKVDPDRPHHVVQCKWLLHAYVLSHFLSALVLTTYLDAPTNDGILEVLVYCIMVIASLSSIGQLYDNTPYARHFETLRCFALMSLQVFLPVGIPVFVSNLIFYHHVLSATLWLFLPRDIQI
ncbi:alkylglycerol monooxygenase-like [Oratosquilla oratoria]|uniref:alkylglycerol monooxygenase-like n=1 Tax=Oratosquilla oratoria TaxID=337810 RepID=UPI003F769924